LKKKLLLVSLSLFSIFTLQVSYASESAKSLHDSKCLGCHDSEAYTRKDHIVKSLSNLSQRVKVCTKQAAKANWTNKQMDSVTEYLNTNYYKF